LPFIAQRLFKLINFVDKDTEFMNIVYLLGNGFDVNLGMKTKYSDFYKYYLKLPKDEDSSVIAQFKEKLQGDLKNWSDLELALGNYLEYLSTEDDAVELHRHLVEHLSTYIQLEEDKYPFDKDQVSVFASSLIDPESKLVQREMNEIKAHKSRWANYSWDMKIITFNYSKSVERLIQNRKTIGRNNGMEINYTGLEHIHGLTSERMILGVNDSSQIANTILRNSQRVASRYVKTSCNATTRLDHDARCAQWISKANLICAFGLSFGDTDKKWWKAVGNRLKSDCKMILFEYNPNKRFNGNQHVDQMEEEDAIKERFLAKTNVEKSSWDNVKKNIYVAYNTNMFKMDMGQKTKW
jgi:hypothetical protein